LILMTLVWKVASKGHVIGFYATAIAGVSRFFVFNRTLAIFFCYSRKFG